MLNRQTCNFGLDISRNRDKRTDIFSFFPYVIKEITKEGINMNNCCANTGNGGYGAGFALLVVLFILLIIVGAAFIC